MSGEFVHLHNHSEYSMLDSICRISDIIQWAVENSTPAVALTDHGNMFGAWEFYTTAQKAGVNPIVGCEVYVTPSDRRKGDKDQNVPYHLTLLSENTTGYKNLMKLVSLGYTEGLCDKPCIDMELLREYREGIIALTGCIDGQVPHLFAAHRRAEAIQCFKTLIDIMGARHLYVEIQNHYIRKEQKAYPYMVNLAREYEIPIVGTNNCHYLRKLDHPLHDVLLCIQNKTTIKDPHRSRYTNHYYFKNANAMREALKDYPPQAISNTVEIANRCQLNLDYRKYIMPKYDVPAGHTNDSYLKELCYQGLRKKMKNELPSEVRQQLNYELEIIRKTGYAGYFLIVWDYVNYAHLQGYPLTARGSAASSLALYALDVISFNPMDYDCMFERFLNLERVTPPDIDIDFSDRARDHVIDYIVKKYGHDSVGKVATFSTLGPRAAITDVARASGLPLDKAKKMTRLLPYTANISLEDVLAKFPEVKELATLSEYRELIEISTALVGLKRHVSCHASAVVVSNGPLSDYVPLFKKNGQVATQFEGATIEDVGLIKFDVLGLRSLTKTHDSLRMIKENRGKDIRLEDIPFDDAKTYSLVSKGLVQGLFQLETSLGMYNVVRQLRAENFADFSAIAALYRPGPLESGTTRQFIARKNGLQKVEYVHPLLEKALKDTYGLCVYQEQVMQIARDIAGFSLGEADVLRRAMGKVNKAALKAQRHKFVAGACAKGILKTDAEKVFDLLEPFGGFAFNKSHSVAFAIITYRMAYLKTHYPHEFMAAIMTSECDDTSKIIAYRKECQKLEEYLGVSINLLLPDINRSSKYFSVDGNAINFGLITIKHVGDRAIDVIISARDRGGHFRSLQDFCERVDTRIANKRTIGSLILSGAFDSLEGCRAPLIANLEKIMKLGKLVKSERDRGQLPLFPFDIKIPFTETSEYEPFARLAMEKSLVGYYLSGHPVQEYRDIIRTYATADTETLSDYHNDAEVDIIGLITHLEKLITPKGDSTALFALEDLKGVVRVDVLPSLYRKARTLSEGQIVWMRGIVKNSVQRTHRHSDERSEIKKPVIQAYEVMDIKEFLSGRDALSTDSCESASRMATV